MKNLKLIALVACLVTLVACAEDQVDAQKDKSDKPKTQLEEVLSTQLDALEKSKQVQQQLSDAAEKRANAIQD